MVTAGAIERTFTEAELTFGALALRVSASAHKVLDLIPDRRKGYHATGETLGLGSGNVDGIDAMGGVLGVGPQNPAVKIRGEDGS